MDCLGHVKYSHLKDMKLILYSFSNSAGKYTHSRKQTRWCLHLQFVPWLVQFHQVIVSLRRSTSTVCSWIELGSLSFSRSDFQRRCFHVARINARDVSWVSRWNISSEATGDRGAEPICYPAQHSQLSEPASDLLICQQQSRVIVSTNHTCSTSNNADCKRG